jgi:aminomethyltransferase
MKFSPLDAAHRSLNAKMVPFGGWEMPLAYSEGTLSEHAACRASASMFDVSHLGTVRVEGVDAFDRLQAALTNDLSKIAPGRAQYTHLLSDSDASVLDDIIVWWVSENVFDVMPNASNTDRVVAAIGGVDTTASRAVIAVQGPDARRESQPFVRKPLTFHDSTCVKSLYAATRVSLPVPDTQAKTVLKLQSLSTDVSMYGMHCSQLVSLLLD